MIERNCLLHDLAQLLEDGFFVRTVAPTVNEARRTPDEALVFLRPLDDLRVPCTFLHAFDSSTARFTALIVLGVVPKVKFLVILSEAKNLLFIPFKHSSPENKDQGDT